MKLTPEILASAYSYLAETKPFTKWNLPAAEDVTFRVVKSREYYGRHRRSAGRKPTHHIEISQSLVSHTYTLMLVMAHELVHVALGHHKAEGRGAHGVSFRKLAAEVSAEHGFDPAAF